MSWLWSASRVEELEFGGKWVFGKSSATVSDSPGIGCSSTIIVNVNDSAVDCPVASRLPSNMPPEQCGHGIGDRDGESGWECFWQQGETALSVPLDAILKPMLAPMQAQCTVTVTTATVNRMDKIRRNGGRTGRNVTNLAVPGSIKFGHYGLVDDLDDWLNRLEIWSMSMTRRTPLPPNRLARVGGTTLPMTSFVDSCVQTVAGSAGAVQKLTRRNPRAAKLLKALTNKKKILVTTHMHPDPDALGSSFALYTLLTMKLKDATIHLSVKGEITGGLNAAFTRYSNMPLTPWDDAALSTYDAVVLLDSQPAFAYSPLPANFAATAVIDHHPNLGKSPNCEFCDVRTDVGATSSIIFNYFMELETPINPDLSATLLYAIETDLAGAARRPAKLDAVALSSLTLTADMRRLYEMRYVDLPRAYYVAFAQALISATCHDHLLIAHLDQIDSLEKPAVLADFLLRYDAAKWCLVTAVHGERLVMSLRTIDNNQSAGRRMAGIVRQLGYGGGHNNKAGGYVQLKNTTPQEIDRVRKILSSRLMKALKIPASHTVPLVRLQATE